MSHAHVFRTALGAAFDALPACIRAVHGGDALVLEGGVSVIRGRSFLARIACLCARLPQEQQDGRLRVRIDVHTAREVWTREFGNSPRMVSELSTRSGYLIERFDPVRLWFVLGTSADTLMWRLARVSILGIAIPARLLAG